MFFPFYPRNYILPLIIKLSYNNNFFLGYKSFTYVMLGLYKGILAHDLTTVGSPFNILDVLFFKLWSDVEAQKYMPRTRRRKKGGGRPRKKGKADGIISGKDYMPTPVKLNRSFYVAIDCIIQSCADNLRNKGGSKNYFVFLDTLIEELFLVYVKGEGYSLKYKEEKNRILLESLTNLRYLKNNLLKKNTLQKVKQRSLEAKLKMFRRERREEPETQLEMPSLGSL